jgi:hypothetical protein
MNLVSFMISIDLCISRLPQTHHIVVYWITAIVSDPQNISERKEIGGKGETGILK